VKLSYLLLISGIGEIAVGVILLVLSGINGWSADNSLIWGRTVIIGSVVLIVGIKSLVEGIKRKAINERKRT
jgi:uncharacterized protein (DUF983 family)